MAEWHLKSKRKKSGGLRKSIYRCDKKLAWKGGFAANTTIAKSPENKEIKVERTRGGNQKQKAKHVYYANVQDKNSKKSIKAKIITVKENTANPEFVRRNILTKGAVIKVEIDGKEQLAKITSRPGQDGTVNAVLI